jgi:hypothetical protein
VGRRPYPLGYATVNKKLVIVPEEAETVRTTVGTTQRSIAAMASAWLRKKVRQLCDGGPRHQGER